MLCQGKASEWNKQRQASATALFCKLGLLAWTLPLPSSSGTLLRLPFEVNDTTIDPAGLRLHCSFDDS